MPLGAPSSTPAGRPPRSRYKGWELLPNGSLLAPALFEAAASLRAQHLISRPPCEGRVGFEPCGS